MIQRKYNSILDNPYNTPLRNNRQQREGQDLTYSKNPPREASRIVRYACITVQYKYCTNMDYGFTI